MCILGLFKWVRYDHVCNFTNTNLSHIHSIAESGWSTDGLKTESVTRDGNMVTITCSTIHLTSFAVLVDVSGGSKVCIYVYAHKVYRSRLIINDILYQQSADHKSLEVISYMGISISIACLFLTIIFFASIGYEVDKSLAII